jgi:hypothetical protein
MDKTFSELGLVPGQMLYHYLDQHGNLIITKERPKGGRTHGFLKVVAITENTITLDKS